MLCLLGLVCPRKARGQSLTQARAVQQAEVDILGVDGILYKGRMSSQVGARPVSSVVKELAGEGIKPSWASLPWVSWICCVVRGDARGAQSQHHR